MRIQVRTDVLHLLKNESSCIFFTKENILISKNNLEIAFLKAVFARIGFRVKTF
jgi:hypothetical protein